MDEAELARMRETPPWLDEDPPQGLLRALVADRERRIGTHSHAADSVRLPRSRNERY